MKREWLKVFRSWPCPGRATPLWTRRSWVDAVNSRCNVTRNIDRHRQNETSKCLDLPASVMISSSVVSSLTMCWNIASIMLSWCVISRQEFDGHCIFYTGRHSLFRNRCIKCGMSVWVAPKSICLVWFIEWCRETDKTGVMCSSSPQLECSSVVCLVLCWVTLSHSQVTGTILFVCIVQWVWVSYLPTMIAYLRRERFFTSSLSFLLQS